MTHSLIGADRGTHLKILGVALVGGLAFLTVGFMARTPTPVDQTARIEPAGVVKASKVITWTGSDTSTVR